MSDTGDMLRILGRHVGSYEDWNEVDDTQNIFYGVRLAPRCARPLVGDRVIDLTFDHLTGKVQFLFEDQTLEEIDAVEWLTGVPL